MLKVYDEARNDDTKLSLIKRGYPMPKKGAFRWVLVGSSGSGKSNLIKNVLFNDDLGYDKYFDEIYIFCGSLDDVHELSSMVKSRDLAHKIAVKQVFDDQLIKQIFTEIENDPTHPRVLMVFDDQLANGISSRNKANVIDEIYQRGRHAKVSVIISTQKYKSLNLNMRQSNATHVTVFNGTNNTDLEQIAEEHSGLLDTSHMLQVLRTVLGQGQYRFLTVDYVADRDDRLKNYQFQRI